MPPKTSASRPKPEPWKIRLYIKSSVPQHQEILGTLKAVCKEQGLGRNALEIVDVESTLGEIEREAILALPMIVRLSPLPIRRIIGGASRPGLLCQSLGIHSTLADAHSNAASA